MTAAIGMLRAIEGARAARTTVHPLWTMPGHLARNGRLTGSSVPRWWRMPAVRRSARPSTSSARPACGPRWGRRNGVPRSPCASTRTSTRPTGSRGHRLPPPIEVAPICDRCSSAYGQFDGRPVRNHSKFISIDHRFLLVTSANFSWSAENGNLEFGLLTTTATWPRPSN